MAANTTPRKAVNLRLDHELHGRLVAYAKRTERSANAAAVHAIRTFLDQQERAGSDDLHLR